MTKQTNAAEDSSKEGFQNLVFALTATLRICVLLGIKYGSKSNFIILQALKSKI